MVVLSEASLVPDRNLIRPPPNQFTHEVIRPQPYFLDQPQGRPEGAFGAGTRVVLMAYDGGPYCRVADGQGLYVNTAYEGLRPLSR